MADMKPLRADLILPMFIQTLKAIAANSGMLFDAFQDDQEGKILQHILFGSIGFLKGSTPPHTSGDE